MKKLAHKIHDTQTQAVARAAQRATAPPSPPPLEQQIAILNEVIGALVDVVGPATIQARLDARRAARAAQPPKKGAKP